MASLLPNRRPFFSSRPNVLLSFGLAVHVALGLVLRSDQTTTGSELNFFFVLDYSATAAPEGHATVTTATAFDAVALSDLRSLQQGPAKPRR